MTVSSSASRNQYTATAGQTVFAYTFEIVSDDDIVVLKNGVTLTKTADYTVSGVGSDSGGNVTLVVGATAGDILTLYRDMAYERLTDYTNAGDFLAADVNNDFDRLWIATQQVNEEVNRSIKAPVTDPLTIDMTIPAKADRLGKILQFNATTGDPETVTPGTAFATGGMSVFNFTGDGSDTTFVLSRDPGGENNTQIYIDGVYQQKDTYSVSGTTITFSAAPPNLSTIEVMVFDTFAVGDTTASSVSFTQAGSSTERNVQLKLQESVSVKDFGAVGDGVTDDTAAIQAAIDYCETNGAKLFGAKGTYKITSTIVMDADENFIADLSDMVINVDASSVSTAIAIGQAGTSSDRSQNFQVKLPNRINNTAKTGAGWSGFDTSVGVHLRTLYGSYIHVSDVVGFGVGLKCAGYQAGCVYNHVFIQRLYNNKINLLLGSDSGNASWTNENIFYGGEYGHSSSEGTATSGVYHIKTQRDVASGINGPNNNLFLKPSIEGNVPEFHIYLYDSSYNNFIQARYEVSLGDARIKLESSGSTYTNKNIFFGGYNVDSLAFTRVGSTPYNHVIGAATNNAFNYTGAGNLIANSGGDTASNPHYMGFFASDYAFEKDSTSTDWAYKLYSQGLHFKEDGETNTGMQLEADGYILLRDHQGVSTDGAEVYQGFGSLYLMNKDDGFVRIGQNDTINLVIDTDGNTIPGTNNAYSLGKAGERWTEVFAVNGTINTSDSRQKQQARSLSAAEQAAATACKGLLKAFKFNHAVEAKGDGARIHFGILAQEVRDAFTAQGLDANDYGLFCYDQWDAQPEIVGRDGTVIQEAREAGDSYGVRYEELLAFIIAAM